MVKDSNSCSATGLILVEQPNAIDLNPLSFDSATCNGLANGSASVGGITGVTGGNGSSYTYTWANALTPLVDLGQNNDTAINLTSGTYNIKVEDIKGCSDSGTISVLEPDVLSLTDTILDSATCSIGGIALVKVTGGTPNYTYLWDDGLPGQATDTAINLAAGTYKVVVTDNNICKDSINVTVPVIGGPTVVIDTVIDVLCFGANSGGINITTNGVLPITYLWTGPNGYTSALEDITNLEAGSYSVDITDGNTCVSAIDTIINAPLIDISINSSVKDLKCYNDNSGEIEVLSITNGTAPYVYNWSGPNGYTSNAEDITSLEAGVYVLSLTDSNLCAIVDDSTIVLEPDTISITETLLDPNCNANDGSITVTPSGGGGRC